MGRASFLLPLPLPLGEGWGEGCARLFCVAAAFRCAARVESGGGDFAPAGESLSLLRQRKEPKKGDPAAAVRLRRTALRCSRSAGSRSNSLRCAPLKQSRALIRRPLRSSTPQRGGERERGPHGPSLRSASGGLSLRSARAYGRRAILFIARGRRRAPATGIFLSEVGTASANATAIPPAPRRNCRAASSSRGSPLPPPLGMRRGAQRQADQGSRCLTGAKRREFSETPPDASTAGCPVAQRRGRSTWGRLFLVTSFGEAKEVTRPRGRNPRLHPQHVQCCIEQQRHRKAGRTPHPHPLPKRERANPPRAAAPTRTTRPWASS